MKKKIYKIATVIILLTVITSLLICGCNNSSNDSADSNGYGIIGRISSADGLQYLGNVECVLKTYDGPGTTGTVMGNDITDEDGNYSFSGIPAGKYMITAEKDGYVTVDSIFDVDSDTTNNIVMVAIDEWSAVYGADHPYDANTHYMEVCVVNDDLDTGMSSVSVDIEPNNIESNRADSYQDKGFLHENGSVDWDADVTYGSGRANFHDVNGENQYKISVTKDNHTFDSVSDAETTAGKITSYTVSGKGSAPDSSALIPSSIPFTYSLGINYETWTVGRTNRDIGKDLDQISKNFKIIRTYHSTAVGTSDPTNPQIEPTQQTVITYVVNNGLELVMGTNNSELAQGGYGTPWSAGLMCDRAYTDLWVQMLINSFGSADAVKTHLKGILLGNEVDCNGPPVGNGSFDTYKDTWIPDAFDNLKASMSAAGLGDIPISTTIANYPLDNTSNKVAVATQQHITKNWGTTWNGGKPFILCNQYTPNWGKSTDFDSVITYFVGLANLFNHNPDVYIGETGFSAENGSDNQVTVVNAIFDMLNDQHTQSGGMTVPLFVFEAFDLPSAPSGQQQMGIYSDDANNVPTGVKSGINIPTWSTTPAQ